MTHSPVVEMRAGMLVNSAPAHLTGKSFQDPRVVAHPTFAYAYVPVTNRATIELSVVVKGICTLVVVVDGIVRLVLPSLGQENGYPVAIILDRVYCKSSSNKVMSATMKTSVINARRITNSDNPLKYAQVGAIELIAYAVGASPALDGNRPAPMPHFNDNSILRGRNNQRQMRDWMQVPPTGNDKMTVSPTHEVVLGDKASVEDLKLRRNSTHFENFTRVGAVPLFKMAFFLRSQGMMHCSDVWLFLLTRVPRRY